MTTDDEIRDEGWRKISDTVPHRDDCPGVGNGCTTDFWAASTADILRARSWAIGEVIEGREYAPWRADFDVKRLRIQWVGRELVVFTRVEPDGSNGREDASWVLSCRCWGPVVPGLDAAPEPV